MKKLLDTLLNHERYETIAVIICLILLGIFYGCQPKVESLLNPGQRITRKQLDNEIEHFLRDAEIAAADLDQQEQIRSILFQTALTASKTGTFNYLPLITSIGTILGIGAAADNVRKRKEIKSLKGP